MYRKPTHTDRYLHAKSHHPAQKQSAINSFVHRAFIISDKEHLQTELNHLKTALQKNGHDKKDIIIKTINKHANKTTDSDTQSDERILSILTCVKGIINRISRILNKHNIRTIFKSPKKIGQILRNSKDLHSAPQECTKYLVPAGKYTLEKLRMVNLWIKEYHCDVRLKHVTQSALSEYNIETEHQILFDKTANSQHYIILSKKL